jgi:hypothetical protein
MSLFVLGGAFVVFAPQWIESCRRGPVERALGGIFLVWIVLPGLVREMQVSHPGVSATKLLRLPLSRTELFAAAVLGGFSHPAVMSLFLLTWVVLVPLGAATGTLFVVACVALSWTVVLAVTVLLRTRAGLLAATLILLAVALYGRPWLPPALAARAVDDSAALAGLVAWDVVAIAAAPVLLGSLLHGPPSRGRRSRKTRPLVGLPGLPLPVGVTAEKELRYLSRTADALVAGGIGWCGAVYVLVSGEPVPVLLALIPGLVVLAQPGAPLNAFGLDRAGIDRYRLLPLRGSEMLASKNLAFGALLLLQLLPLVLVAAWRFGALAAAALLFGLIAYAFAAVVAGNFASARATAPREFHGVESIDQSGGIVPVLALVAAWFPPAAIAAMAAPLGEPAIAGGELLLAALLAGIYARALRRAGLALEARFDVLRERVAE